MSEAVQPLKGLRVVEFTHMVMGPTCARRRRTWSPRSAASASRAAGSRTLLEVGISTAFGCTLQGHVPPDEVVRLVQAVLDEGVDAVSLADTVGYADPAMVSSLFERVLRVAGDKLAAAHFHDTRGLGLANCYAALQLGIARLDACTAGIGGCPHAPGASGNVATEDLAYMLHSM